MKTTKTMQVVMLPTEKASPLYIDTPDEGKLKLSMNVPQTDNKWPNQFLYIVSDNEIKENDWFLSLFKSFPLQYNKEKHGELSKDYKKIEATTDTSLGYTNLRVSPVPNFCDLPQLNQQFIEAYVKAEDKITEVQVEIYTEFLPLNAVPSKQEHITKIKTRSDNTIIIHQSRTYSKEEVINLVHKIMKEDKFFTATNYIHEDRVNKWIEENL